MAFITRRVSSFAILLCSFIVNLPVAVAQEHSVFTTLYSFRGGTDGATPVAGLIRDNAGNLFGTTANGGTNNSGTVFKLDRRNRETVLYSFTGGADGWAPLAGLSRDAAGNLYGTTIYGGVYDWGTVFKLDTSGKETVLYTFTGLADGGSPDAELIRDAAGNLYSTALNGGIYEGGVAFKLDADGQQTVLYNFDEVSGYGAYAGLVGDTAGNLYGVTAYGGAHDFGTVFKLDRDGNYTVLHDFMSLEDGAGADGDLIRDSSGNLYGTTSVGGLYYEGTVFKVDVSGVHTVLYNFSGTDGAIPVAGVIADAAGNFYGTTESGGTYNMGTVFELDASGTETVLHNFSGGRDGGSPEGGLIFDEKENLYGTAAVGGAYGKGTVFRVTP